MYVLERLFRARTYFLTDNRYTEIKAATCRKKPLRVHAWVGFSVRNPTQKKKMWGGTRYKRVRSN